MTIEAIRIYQAFGEPLTPILHDINLKINEGEFVALTGRSGSGKSTLLYILSSLDRPSSGRVEIDGRNLEDLSLKEQHMFRNREVGFVFQFHFLLPEISALENILMPARKVKEAEVKKKRALQLMDEFNLNGLQDRLPRHLSGGEQQRVAIARALLMKPKYLFADEPTGSLDTMNSETVIGLLEKANREDRTTVILVTHDPGFAARAQRAIHLADGRLV